MSEYIRDQRFEAQICVSNAVAANRKGEMKDLCCHHEDLFHVAKLRGALGNCRISVNHTYLQTAGDTLVVDIASEVATSGGAE